jgi:predicted ATPase/DNA-binding XRE family transcriptional regulator
MRTEPLPCSFAVNQRRNQADIVAQNLPAFGALLRRHRTAAALSQEELAERAGVSVRALSDLERGVHRAPRLETVRMLAEALALGEDDRAHLLAMARPVAEPSASGARSHPLAMAALPLPPTRLIGRETEMAELSDLLAHDDVRLVTLTGPGGTGKTHLALAVAANAVGRYRDGVCFIDLSALTDPNFVVPAIAAALGVRGTGDAPSRETISDLLRDRKLLLILDNCEQVLAAAPEVAALLAACPQLAILTTSREPLHIRAEREVAVAPLRLPDPGDTPSLAEVQRSPAVVLFVERARAASAGFTLTAENAADVTSICVRLDGLPLAIELAAARIKVLPPGALLARLEQRLPMLTGGGRDFPARQRTMRDAIAWSYDLLTPEEQRLFRHLAVFVGGFTLTAAEAVAGPEGARVALDGIVALVEQSLLRQSPGIGGEPRYLMLETVREYGLERLQEAGDMEVARARHAAHFLTLTGGLAPGSQLLQSPRTTAPITADRDNLHLALTWFDERGEIDALLQLSIVLQDFYFAPGLYREALQWMERSLERSSDSVSVARFDVLMSAMGMAVYQGDLIRAERYCDEGLRLARELDDPLLIGTAQAFMGWVRYRQHDYDRAEALLTGVYHRLHELASHTPAAVPIVGMALLVLGDTALAQEHFERAGKRYEEGSDLCRTISDDTRLSDVQAGLGAVSYCTGDTARAAVLYAENLKRAQRVGYTIVVASTLLGLAGVVAESGHPEAGARLLGAAEGIAASLGSPIFPRDQPVHERALATLTAALGEERLTAARGAGQTLMLEAAIGEAQAVAEAVMQSLP